MPPERFDIPPSSPETLEQGKELTEGEIEQIIEKAKSAVMPFYDKIEALRGANPEREVGGRFVDGKMELFDESKWQRDSVIGESYEKGRELAKKVL